MWYLVVIFYGLLVLRLFCLAGINTGIFRMNKFNLWEKNEWKLRKVSRTMIKNIYVIKWVNDTSLIKNQMGVEEIIRKKIFNFVEYSYKEGINDDDPPLFLKANKSQKNQRIISTDSIFEMAVVNSLRRLARTTQVFSLAPFDCFLAASSSLLTRSRSGFCPDSCSNA